jgi:hypothetical protein
VRFSLPPQGRPPRCLAPTRIYAARCEMHHETLCAYGIIPRKIFSRLKSQSLRTRNGLEKTRPRANRSIASFPRPHRRFAPLTTMSTLRLPHCEQTSRRRHSGTGVSGPYQRACSAGSSSPRRPHALHQTTSRRWAAAALSRVMGGPRYGFICPAFSA